MRFALDINVHTGRRFALRSALAARSLVIHFQRIECKSISNWMLSFSSATGEIIMKQYYKQTHHLHLFSERHMLVHDDADPLLATNWRLMRTDCW
ncbi:hypothetical protein OH492_12930 [Vibrio chagasii]|nr:hypothetical protein [Vibrio chagasii]